MHKRRISFISKVLLRFLCALLLSVILTIGLSLLASQEKGVLERLSIIETAYAYPSDGWYQSGGYWYYYKNGQMVTNSWQMDSTDWAYLGSDGRAYQDTWAYLSDSSGTFWYYFNSYAHIIRNQWQPDTTSWGYLDADGHAVTGWQTIGYYRYYFSLSGASMQRGWLNTGTGSYYLRTGLDNPAPGDDGAMLESGLWYIDGSWRWFRATGKENPNFGLKELSVSSTAQQRNNISYDYEFYSVGSRDQNCLAFALDYGNSWVWPWGGSNPTVSEAKTYSNSIGYSVYSASSSISYPYIVAYAKNGRVTHFARVNTTGNTYAKWGSLEIFKHGSYDPYTNNVYGSAVFCLA